MRRKEFRTLELRVIVVFLVAVIVLVTGLYYIMLNQYYTVMINKLKEDAVNVHKYAEMVVDERSFLDLNSVEDQETELYIEAHAHLDEIRRIANIRYLYTAKLNDAGELIYVVDGLDLDDELFRNIGDPIEEEIIPILMLCMDDEIVLGNEILDTEWGIVYVAYFPFHDAAGNVIGAIGMEFDCENLYHAMNRALLLTLVFSLILTSLAVGVTLFITRKIVRRTETDFQSMENSVNEMHEQTKMMLNEIEQRDKLLLAVNHAAELMLTTDEDEDLASMITASMELIGNTILADRIHIWRYKSTDDDMILTNRYFWVSEVGAQKAPITQDWSFSLKDWPGWLDQYKKGICTNSFVSQLLPDEKAFYESLDTKSVVIIPLFLDDQLWGLFSIDDCENERILPDEEIKILRSVSLMMVSAITRNALVARRTQELALLKEEADKANRSKSLFLASMSHEIRTPMNAILGSSEIMMQSDTLSDDMIEWLNRIYTSGNLLLGIINDILDLSKIEAGKLEIIENDYKLASAINDAAQLNMLRCEGKHIVFELNIDENLPAVLIGDELRIKQILNNLLSNAFKFTDSGSVKMSVGFEPGPDTESLVLLVSVRDTGYGMTQEQLNLLFDAYSRFDNTDGNTIEGTGLGLPITRRLIYSMDGEINVESEQGIGTEFIIRLPQKISGKEVLGSDVVGKLKSFKYTSDNRGERRRSPRDIMPYGSVLIVDDVETNRFVATGLLKIFKLQIDTACSGYEAMKKIEDGKIYDVIFMDHMMPGIDGVETTKRLRDTGYTAPIVALTANVLTGQSELLLKSGFDDFIAKPIDIRILTSILNKHIRDKQPPEVIEAAREQARNAGKVNPDTVQAGNILIPGIDTVKGLDRYNGDSATYLLILRSYSASVSSMLDGIGNVNKNDLSDYRLSVHSIKGASFDIFADAVGRKAAQLESAAKEGDFDFIRENNAGFLQEARSLVSAIDEAITAFDTETIKPVKDKPDTALLLKLRAACDVYNMDDADAVMAEIDSYKYVADDGLAEWLRKSIDTMSFSEIADKLAEYE